MTLFGLIRRRDCAMSGRWTKTRAANVGSGLVVAVGMLGCWCVSAAFTAPARAGMVRLTAPPEPSANPPRWELRIEITHSLRLIKVGDQHYWFMTYLVTNRTNEDQIFVPGAVLYTDVGDIIRDGDGVPYEVTKHLLELMANPLLESNTHIIGTLKQGKENAREGMIVWKAERLEEINEVVVFISGLSSETQVTINPETNEEVVLRKTLELRYPSIGDVTADVRQPVRDAKVRWIMR